MIMFTNYKHECVYKRKLTFRKEKIQFFKI
jgi:hypothetical protein